MNTGTIARMIASTFGSGFFPIAPGTVGSIIAVLALWLLPELSVVTLIFYILVFFFIGVWAATEAEKSWGHDPGRVNWDEVVGMLITLIALPKIWFVYIAAFAAFRFFDVVKPTPVNELQQLPKGWGVMVDDVAAGLYSVIVMQVIFRLIFKVA